ncbi:MAG TPA: cache domain-containing protein [Methanoregulaceae archaeon]|nr:cache domain-containing protein [Methanoregulaceae archaeon]HQJ87453.1 cache domain-containing protein [Methanoregulaceae archaeon]
MVPSPPFHAITAVLAIVLFACGCLQAPSPEAAGAGPSVSPGQGATAVPDLVGHVGRVAAFARENGRERTIAALNDPSGPFASGGVPVYARDYNGTLLAASPGVGPGGTADPDATDAFGVPYVRHLGETARYGKGLVSHASPDPARPGTVRSMLEAVQDVDGTFYVGAGISDPGDGLFPIPGPDTGRDRPGVDDLEAFVRGAAAYGREHGRVAALAAFDDPAGQFSRGPLSVTAFDAGGTVLAGGSGGGAGVTLPGLNLLNYHDADGVAVVRGMRNLAERGGGLYYTVAPVTVEGREVFLPVIGSVEPVDRDWWLCAGTVDPAFSGALDGNLTGLFVRNQTRSRLYDLVHRAVAYAREHGKDQALAAIDDPAGPFVEGDLFVWAESTDGTMLADPFWTSARGKNYLDYTDPYGMQTTRVGIDAMEDGTGFSHALFPDTAANGTAWVPKLVYQAPVDREWWIGSGVYGVEVRA